MTIEKIRDYILYITIGLVPLVFVPFLPSPLISTKVIVLVVGVSLALIATAAVIIKKGSLQIKITVFNLAVILFTLASLLGSYFRTPNKFDAFFLPGTATVIIASAIIFFLLSSSEDKRKSIYIQTTLIISAVVVAIVTLLSFLGLLSFIPGLPGSINEAYFSLVNGILPSMVFMLVILPLAITRAVRSKDNLKRGLFAVASIFMTISLVIGLFFYVSKATAENVPAGLKLPTYGSSWGILVDTLKVSPLFGTGHGNYITVFNRFRPAAYNTTDVWNLRFNSAHSFFVTYITETGIIGLAAVGLLLYIFIRLFKNHIVTRSKSANKELIEVNLPGVEILVSLTFLIVSMLLVPASLTLIMLLFVLLAIADKGKDTVIPLKTVQYDAGAASRAPAIVVAIVFVTLSGFSLYKVSRVTAAEFYYQKALSSAAKNDVQPTFSNLAKAIRTYPGTDRYYITLSRLSLAAARSIAQKEEITDQDRQILANTIRDAINSAKQAVALNRTRAVNWEILANTYRAIIPVATGADQFAIQTYSQAIALDPLNTDFRVALGAVYYQLGDFDSSVEVLKLATLTKPDHANARFNLAAAYREQGEIEKAINEVTIVLSLVQPDSQDFEFAKAELERLQQMAGSGLEPSTGPAAGQELTQPTQEKELDPKLELPEGAEPPEAPEEIDEKATPSSSPSPTPTGSAIGSPTPSPTSTVNP